MDDDEARRQRDELSDRSVDDPDRVALAEAYVDSLIEAAVSRYEPALRKLGDA